MTTTPFTRPPDYLPKAERFAGRALACREEVGILLGAAAADPALGADFDQALFLAKFLEGAAGILRRTGPGGDDVRKLAAELSDATGRVSAILARLFDAGAPERSEEYRKRFLPAGAGAPGPLLALLSDLALLKNYELHGGSR